MAKVLGISKEVRSFETKDGTKIEGKSVSLSLNDERYDGVRVAEVFSTLQAIEKLNIAKGAEVPAYWDGKKFKIGERQQY